MAIAALTTINFCDLSGSCIAAQCANQHRYCHLAQHIGSVMPPNTNSARATCPADCAPIRTMTIRLAPRCPAARGEHCSSARVSSVVVTSSRQFPPQPGGAEVFGEYPRWRPLP